MTISMDTLVEDARDTAARYEDAARATIAVSHVTRMAEWVQTAASLLYVCADEIERLRARVRQLEAEPTDEEVQAMVPADVHERGWQWRPTATDTAFAPPFGTIRQCRVCGCLVAGGPTACARCVKARAAK